MDHYSEQLVKRATTRKDLAIRLLIIVAAAAVLSLFAFGAMITGFYVLILLGLGAIYLAYYLLGSTSLEYEYIVTNDDLDIDKIIGKRKRKRLITIKLSTVSDIGQYNEREGTGSAVTVIADDARGEGLWYIVCDHSAHGKTMLVFCPTRRTLETIYDGIPYQIRLKAPKLDLVMAEESENEDNGQVSE